MREKEKRERKKNPFFNCTPLLKRREREKAEMQRD